MRALAPMLGPDAALVELPLGATLDRLVGALDLRAALAGGAPGARPGLLERGDSGVLYVDEVNLLHRPSRGRAAGRGRVRRR